MTQFRLELLPDDPVRIESSRAELKTRMRKFVLLADQRDSEVAQEHLTSLAFYEGVPTKPWHLLGYLEHRAESGVYTHDEMQEAFSVAVNGALLLDNVR